MPAAPTQWEVVRWRGRRARSRRHEAWLHEAFEPTSVGVAASAGVRRRRDDVPALSRRDEARRSSGSPSTSPTPNFGACSTTTCRRTCSIASRRSTQDPGPARHGTRRRPGRPILIGPREAGDQDLDRRRHQRHRRGREQDPDPIDGPEPEARGYLARFCARARSLAHRGELEHVAASEVLAHASRLPSAEAGLSTVRALAGILDGGVVETTRFRVTDLHDMGSYGKGLSGADQRSFGTLGRPS